VRCLQQGSELDKLDGELGRKERCACLFGERGSCRQRKSPPTKAPNLAV